MQHFMLTSLAWMLAGQCLLCQCALLKIDYGAPGFFVHIEFSAAIFKRLLTSLTERTTKTCRVYLRPKYSALNYEAEDVTKEQILDSDSSVVPKYKCAYEPSDQSIKCERIKVLVTCQHVQTSDLFGINWGREEEFLSDSSIINSTHQCLGEYGSKWPVTYYSLTAGRYPINFQYTNSPPGQRVFKPTSGESYENTIGEYTYVDTSTLRNLQTTEKMGEPSNSSLTVIVTCSVLGVIILILIGVVTYFLICRKKLRIKRNDKPTVSAPPPHYEEVRFLQGNNSLQGLQTANTNFSAISNIYSYPFPYSVNKKKDKKQDTHVSNVNENSLSEYSNPVDSYGDPNLIRNGVSGSYSELEATSSDLPNVTTNDRTKATEYSSPDDSYHVPRTSNGKAKCNGDYTELESVTYSNKDYQASGGQAIPHDYSDPGDCVLIRITKQKVHEYDKLGEENKNLLHEYDHLELNPESLNKSAIYSLSKNVDC